MALSPHELSGLLAATINVEAIIANAIIVISIVCRYQIAGAAAARSLDWAQVPQQQQAASMPDRLDLANYLPYLVNRLGSALVANFTATTLAPHHLNIDAWRVLAVLSYRGAQRQIDLVGMTSIEVSTMSRLITRLVRMRLVTRRRSESSNREVVIELTAKGRVLVGRIVPLARRLEQEAAADIPARDMAVAKRTLRRMFENMARG